MLTKKQKEMLHSQRCQLEPVDYQSGKGLETRYVISFSLLPGELITLYDSLCDNHSEIAGDVLAFLRNATVRAQVKLPK